MKKWIVTAVDYGETCDGKARVLQVCATKEEAKNWVRNDIETYADDHAGENVKVDFDKMSASFGDRDAGCEWNIEETEWNRGRQPGGKSKSKDYAVRIVRKEVYEHVEHVKANSWKEARQMVEDMYEVGDFDSCWDEFDDVETEFERAGEED